MEGTDKGVATAAVAAAARGSAKRKTSSLHSPTPSKKHRQLALLSRTKKALAAQMAELDAAEAKLKEIMSTQ